MTLHTSNLSIAAVIKWSTPKIGAACVKIPNAFFCTLEEQLSRDLIAELLCVLTCRCLWLLRISKHPHDTMRMMCMLKQHCRSQRAPIAGGCPKMGHTEIQSTIFPRYIYQFGSLVSPAYQCISHFILAILADDWMGCVSFESVA